MPQIEVIRPLEVGPTGGSELTITNRGSNPVYYGEGPTVSSSNKLGTLNQGEHLTVAQSIWIVAGKTPAIVDLREVEIPVQVSLTAGEGIVVNGHEISTSPSVVSAGESAIGVFPAIRYGLTEGGTAAANKTAIDNALTAAKEAGGGTVVLPSEWSFVTNGGHVVPSGCRVVTLGRKAEVRNRGATYCFKLMGAESGSRGGRLEGLSIVGSSGTESAVAKGIGVEISNGQQSAFRDVYVYGFTATEGIGVNFHIAAGAPEYEYVEQTDLVDCVVVNCKTLINFVSDVGSTKSFGYTRTRGLQLQTYEGQTAIKVVSGTLYNANIEANLHYAGKNGVGLEVVKGGIVWQGTRLHIVGERLESVTGCKRLVVKGEFQASGKFYIASGLPDEKSEAEQCGFVEDQLDPAEIEALGNLEIASAEFGMYFPSGTQFWKVTGKTEIKGISGAYEGQLITLQFAEALTIAVSGNIHLNGGVANTFGAGGVLTVVGRSGQWYEVARSELPSSVVSGSPSFYATVAGEPGQLISGVITRSANGAALKAPVTWPDGATGEYEGTESTTVAGAIDSYTITHVLGAVTHTYTQPKVTRNAEGAVTERPAITYV